MSKQTYTHIKELLPEIQTMVAEGRTQKEIAEHLSNELYSHTTQKSIFAHKLLLPVHCWKTAMMLVAGFLFVSVFVLLLKSCFFGFYVNGVTLAGRMKKAFPLRGRGTA